jgi:para-nitrobenzyl esterase
MAQAVVSLHNGQLCGMDNDLGVSTFRGIPYAAAPVGDLRFRPPQPHPGWSGVRDAVAFGSIAPQNGSMEAMLLAGNLPPQSEDCLYLNVSTPACDTGHRPVMVWMHGGAYVSGSGSNPWYDGKTLVGQGDVVVVTANYRLGTFGFCHLADVGGERFAGSGNLGLLDQIAVLRWVRDNVGAFGGDAGNVTIFGESAGGGSVMALLCAPAAEGLFHKAIAQSASFGQFRSRERADAAAQQLLAGLGLTNASDILQCSTQDILAAQGPVEAPPLGVTAFAPTADGVVLFDDIDQLIRHRSTSPNVPLLIGTNHDEMRMFSTFDPSNAALDEAAVVALAEPTIGPDLAPKVVAAYRAADPNATWGQIASTVATEHGFHQPAIRAAAARASLGNPTWMYRFDWASTAFGGALGSCHALELPFVFGTLDHPGAQMFTGGGESQELVAKTMQQAWLSFAHHGDPGWANYDAATRSTMIFNETSAVQHDPDAELRQLWD